MIELDFSNANSVVEDKLVFYNPESYRESIKVDSSAIILRDLCTTGEIIAAYSLIVLGNVKASKIKVAKDLICLGNIEAESIEVDGFIKCFKELKTNELQVSKTSFIESGIIAGNALVEGNLSVGSSLVVDGRLIVGESIICYEGVIGQGEIVCQNLISNDYIEVKVDAIGYSFLIEDLALLGKPGEGSSSKDFVILKASALSEEMNTARLHEMINDQELNQVLDKVEEENKDLTKVLENCIMLGEKFLEFEDVEELLYFATRINEKFKKDYELFRNILKISETRPTKDLLSFLINTNMYHDTPRYMLEMTIYQDFHYAFVDRQLGNISELSTFGITTQNQVSECLALLERSKDMLSKEEYRDLLEKIYGIIGIKLAMIQKFIDI